MSIIKLPWTLFTCFILYLFTLLTHQQDIYSSQTLNYSLLNQQQTITLSLASYFEDPSQVQINYQNSTEGISDSFNITFTNKPVVQISSLQLTATLLDNSTIDFNSYLIIKERSVFNHPNKVYLMENNLIFSIRYRVSSSQKDSYVQAFQVANSQVNCSEIEIQYLNGSYYLHVACLHNNGNTTLYTYLFKEARPDYLNQLKLVTFKEVRTSSNCVRVTLYAFNQLYVTKTLKNSQLLLFCTGTQGGSPSNTTYFLSLQSQNGIKTMITKNVVDQSLYRCLQGSTRVFPYQKGFLSLAQPWLRYYFYSSGINQTDCKKDFLNVSNLNFIAQVQQIGIQYIYIIYHDKIMIKESYSPNYEMININSSVVDVMTIVDFSIARRLLTLLYQNQTCYVMLAFDLRTSYPKLVDTIVYEKNNSDFQMFSVRNFLQVGNYFIIYDREENLYQLNLYLGYQLNISVNNQALTLGTMVLCLSDNQQTQLVLNMSLRDFNDLTLQKSQGTRMLLYQQFFNMKLTGYVAGPLGRFYNYPNRISAFQYINHQHQLSIKQQLKDIKQNVTSFTINNEYSTPIISFYFNNKTVLSCYLEYRLSNREPILSQCKTTKSQKHFIQNYRQIVTLNQERYLQYDNQSVQLCQLFTNGEYACNSIPFEFHTEIAAVKLVSYTSSDSDQDLSVIIYGHKEILYCSLHRSYMNSHFSIATNYHIREYNNPDLAKMSIVDLHFDRGYDHFLILRLKGDQTQLQKVIVYQKPMILLNSSSTLIGHVIDAFDQIDLQTFFCVQNLLVLVYRKDFIFKIREYKVTREYRLKFNRAYPLYGYSIKEGGNHVQNQNFIFLQTTKNQQSYYLVYCPLQPSSNILSHKIAINETIPLFSQQVKPQGNSSLLLIGKDKLIALTLPNLVFKFTDPLFMPQMTLYEFGLGVVDSLEELSILSYQFSYNQKEEEIDYLSPQDIVFRLSNINSQTEFYMQSNNIFGSVIDYDLKTPDTPQCSQIQIERKDIFTKQQCLIYYQSFKYGKLADFAAIIKDGAQIQIVVTDSRLFCVKNRRLPTSTNQQFQDLSQCSFVINNNQVLMTCIDGTTLSRNIYNLTISQTFSHCTVQFEKIIIPDSLDFQDFNIMFSDSQIVFEVPIRLENNKIYYKMTYFNNTINKNYSLLRRQKQPNFYQTQFLSIDSFMSGELFLLLEDGIGIYKISDTNSSISPALWLTPEQIPGLVDYDQELVYIKFISLAHIGDNESLIIELGTVWQSFQIQIIFHRLPNSTSEQTNYELLGCRLVFTYQQYPNCRNSPHSQSQRFQNLVVKICDYQPISYNVFANFISISNDTSNTLIQFYNRSGDFSSSPSTRTDLIYSYSSSENDFVIRGDTMVVGSLFNILCYYQLKSSFSWKITHNVSDTDDSCIALLTISNKHHSVSKQIQIVYDAQEQPGYWTVQTLYIQRVIFFAILLNTLRLVIGRRDYKSHRHKRKNTNKDIGRPQNPANRFEVMVKINSKKNT